MAFDALIKYYALHAKSYWPRSRCANWFGRDDRSRGAVGCRTESDRVRVYEIFQSGEHDRGYKRLRDQKIDREAHNGFEPWYPRETAESYEN